MICPSSLIREYVLNKMQPEMKELVEKEAMKQINIDLNMVHFYVQTDKFQTERVKTAAKAAIMKNKSKVREALDTMKLNQKQRAILEALTE